MKYLFTLCRWLVAGLFIFSGLIKLNDPLGTAIKLEEYFQVFSTDIHPFFLFFSHLSLYLSVLLSVSEVVLGAALLCKLFYKKIVVSLLLLILFFSFLTFYSAYFNKVTDCGCFGDAIALTPWQSFIKDMILLLFLVIIYFDKKVKNNIYTNYKKIWVIFCLVCSFFISIQAIRHLPWIDFRNYKVGNDIKKLMLAEEEPLISYTFEKKGELIKSPLFLNEEEGYKYISMEILNPKKSIPKILNYHLTDSLGMDKTRESLTGKKMFIIIEKVEKMDVETLHSLLNHLKIKNISPIILTADYKNILNFVVENNLKIPYYFSDNTELKTMIRSNPGFLFIENGVVKHKWHHNDIDDIKKKLQR